MIDKDKMTMNKEYAKDALNIIDSVFKDFKIKAWCEDFIVGPTVTTILVKYKDLKTVKTLIKIKDELSKRFNGEPVRYVDRVIGTSLSGYEVPNKYKEEVLYNESFLALKGSSTSIPLGKDVRGNNVQIDIKDTPHMLITGTSGSGKSIFLNCLITTLIARNDFEHIRFVLVDPKRVEMNRYKHIPYLLTPIINDPQYAKEYLYHLVDVMNDRYSRFEKADYSTSLDEYNEWALNHNKDIMPRIIVVLDEYADLVYSCKEVSVPLLSLLQKSRACGIHVVISTQRPTTDVITGNLKANLVTRLCFASASVLDSITVLDEPDAVDLLGCGDYLIKSPLISRRGLVRLQAPYITGKEVNEVVDNIRTPFVEALDEVVKEQDNDDKYEIIKEWVKEQEYVSMSKIQRECAVGFNRAGKYLVRLQEEGIVSNEDNGRKGYKVIK